MQRCHVVLIVTALAAASPGEAQRIRLTERFEDLQARAIRDSCDAPALYGLAIGYVSRQQYDQADSVLKRAITIDPQFAPAWFGLGVIQTRNNRYWSALRQRGGDTAVAHERERRDAFLRRAYLVDPLVDMRLLRTVVEHSDYPSFFIQGLNAFIEGNYSMAYQMVDVTARYHGRLTLDSVPEFVLWVHALSATQTAHFTDAVRDMESLVRRSAAAERNDSTHFMPLQTGEFRYVLGLVHQHAHQNTLAIRMYEQALEADIGNYMVPVQLARIHESEHDWFNAVRRWQQATEINPENHTLYYALGAALANARRWAEAEQALQRAASMEARYAPTWRTLGIVEQEIGNTTAAREAFTRYLAIAPSRNESEIADARTRLEHLP